MFLRVFVIGAARYALACLILWLVGRALLHLTRCDRDRALAWLVAPVAGLACWAVLLGGLVQLHHPLRAMTGVFWLVQVVLVCYGALVAWRVDAAPAAPAAGPTRAAQQNGALLLLLCALLPVALMLPNFLFGLADYPGSRLPGGWSYAAFAQYLWDMPLGADGGHVPLYRFAAALSDGRYVGASAIGMLSTWTRAGETQTTMALLQAVAVFVFASASAAFAVSYGLSWRACVLYVCVTALSGWLLDAIWANNNDNLLMLAYGPALAVAASRSDRRSAGAATMMGVLAAALAYTYPEFAPLVLATTAAFLIEAWWRGGRAQVSPRNLLLALAIVAVLTAPFAASFVQYLFTQIDAGLQTGVARPGRGLFLGLITGPYRIAAFWALGAEQQIARLLAGQTIVAVALFLLLACGIVSCVRERRLGLLMLVVLAAFGAYRFMVRDPYSYGVYKFLIVTLWGITFVTVLGARWLIAISARSSRGRPLLVAVSVATLLAIPAATMTRVLATTLGQPRVSMSRFSSVRQVADLVGDEPVAVMVDDEEAELWALYYLRRARLQLVTSTAYLQLPRFGPTMHPPDELPWSRVRYLLTDSSRLTESTTRALLVEREDWTPVWRSDVLTLWDTGARGWAVVLEATSPNGLEMAPGPWLWLGGEPLRFTVLASHPGSVAIAAAEFIPGPSVPGLVERRVQVHCSPGADRLVAIVPGMTAVAMPVSEGHTTCTWRMLDAPVVRVQPNGDTRPLILALKDPHLQWSRGPVGTP